MAETPDLVDVGDVDREDSAWRTSRQSLVARIVMLWLVAVS